jgi:hypothetical protein
VLARFTAFDIAHQERQLKSHRLRTRVWSLPDVHVTRIRRRPCPRRVLRGRTAEPSTVPTNPGALGNPRLAPAWSPGPSAPLGPSRPAQVTSRMEKLSRLQGCNRHSADPGSRDEHVAIMDERPRDGVGNWPGTVVPLALRSMININKSLLRSALACSPLARVFPSATPLSGQETRVLSIGLGCLGWLELRDASLQESKVVFQCEPGCWAACLLIAARTIDFSR